MTLAFSLEKNYSLLSREGSFVRNSEGLKTNGLLSVLLPHDETMSEGLDEYFDPPLESKYKCPICLLGLCEPVQTICCHRFCKGCILRLMRDGDSKCPVDDEHLSKSELFPDNFAKKELMRHEVFCRMKKKHGCPWKGPLAQLENHYQNCPKYPLMCEKCKKENIPREKMEEHLDKECPFVGIQCPFITVGCTFEGLRLDVNKHVQEQVASHVMDMAKKVGQLTVDSSSTQIEAHRGAAAPRRTRGGMESFPQEQASQEGYLNDLSTRTQHQRNEIDEMRHIITALSNTVHHLEGQLEEACMRQERPVQELTPQFNRLETKLLEYEGRICNGIFIWKIENYQQCCQDALHTYSPPFCTNQHGYKLCLRICLQGNHVGLFVHMMQGCYDNILKWPFTGMMTLCILDQSGAGNHISRTFLARPDLPPFQRPTSLHNYLGYGYTDFAPINLEQINEGQYVKNNTVLVKFEFHPI